MKMMLLIVANGQKIHLWIAMKMGFLMLVNYWAVCLMMQFNGLLKKVGTGIGTTSML